MEKYIAEKQNDQDTGNKILNHMTCYHGQKH